MKFLTLILICLTFVACSNEPKPTPSSSPAAESAASEQSDQAYDAALGAFSKKEYEEAIKLTKAALKKEEDKTSPSALKLRKVLAEALVQKRRYAEAYGHLKVLGEKGDEKYEAMAEATKANIWAEEFFPKLIECRELVAMGEVAEAKKRLHKMQEQADEIGIDSSPIAEDITKLP